MQPMKSLPPGYGPGFSINLSKSPTLVVIFTAASMGLFVLSGWLGFRYLSVVRPDVQSFEGRFNGFGDGLLFLVSLVALVAFTVALHELVHGLFFWLFTGERPHLGWKWLILISLAGIALLRLVPDHALPAVLFGIAINTAGSIGDIVVIFLLMFQAKKVLVRDTGDAIQIYK